MNKNLFKNTEKRKRGEREAGIKHAVRDPSERLQLLGVTSSTLG